MNEKIIQFAQKQKVTSLCCIDETGKPYCFNCFFSFDGEERLLYFKSSSQSNHMKLMSVKPEVAGAILPDKLNVLAIKGIQYTGILLSSNEELTKTAAKHYHKKYPFALTIPGDVFAIQLIKIKMTDSSNVFGKKIEWERERRDAVEA